MDAKSVIRNKLQELKFSQIGFAKYQLGFEEDFYFQYLGEGMHGQMEYLLDFWPYKQNPTLLLPGIKTVLVAAYPCAKPIDIYSDEYQIASYAYGRDYHRILKKKRKAFYVFFKDQFPDHEIYGSSDSGPILEKAWAKRAGLGFMGKNSNMIFKEAGSYFFLTVFLTTLDLSSDQETKNYCGSCTRCKEICPTQAIVQDYLVDARKCISYLTIEYDGVIPRELRAKIGNHLFGCDDCQSVCPWNRFAKNDLIDPDLLWQREQKNLAELVALKESDFRDYFRASPLLRSKYQGFMRNLAVVIGNSGDAENISLAFQLLNFQDELIQVHALWALAQLSLPEARLWIVQHRKQVSAKILLEEMDAIDAEDKLR